MQKINNKKMKYILSLLLVLISLQKIQSQMTEEERQSLLDKVTKTINTFKKKDNQLYSSINIHSDYKEIKYSPTKIKEVIDKYKFPQNYNFIVEEKPNVNIKDQKNCGSCWAFASTTALAYRYHKIGIDVDLSPQYLISCYIRDCEAGDQLIDPQLSLVKDGTVTEECLPYASGNKYIPKCPSSCKNNEEFKKYYSKNPYTTFLDFSEENYYDIVAIIMDQLIHYGPVSSAIALYDDFYELSNDNQCLNTIYRYDGTSSPEGGHAIVIVGYGYEKSKYYWLIQNSWGEAFCENGFAKIEFGQIGIERVAFSEPYIPTNSTNSTEGTISVNIFVNEDCNMKFTSDSDDSDNSFEMEFKNVDSSGNSNSNFYYQCGFVNLKGQKEGHCFYNMDAFNYSKGYYKYDNNKPLKKNNIFNIDFSALSNKQFYYYGYDYIDSLLEEEGIVYVSEVGSKILLFDWTYELDESKMSKIYLNENSTTSLSNCKTMTIKENVLYGIYCEITQAELNYFEPSNNSPLVYDILCGAKERTSIVVRRLDKSNYPVFRIKKIIVTEDNRLVYNSLIVVQANIEGSVSKVYGENEFALLIKYEKSGKNYIDLLLCQIPIPSNKEKNYELYCYPNLDKGEQIIFDNMYIYPYHIPLETNYPYEIIMEKGITPLIDEGYDFYIYNKDSNYARFSFLLSYILLLLLF